MTTPRDALRALEQIATEMRNSQQREASSDIVAACIDAWHCRLAKATDELAAIVNQMDSEPTVARPPSFNQQEFDEMCEKGRVAWAGVDPNEVRGAPSESSPAGCERCGELEAENALLAAANGKLCPCDIGEECDHLRQQLATAERTIAELRKLLGAAYAYLRKVAAWSESNDMDPLDEFICGVDVLLQRAESAELTNQQLAEKCLRLVADNDLLRARTADKITNRGG